MSYLRLVVACSFWISCSSFAAKLGDLVLYSALGEPLHAMIELNDVDANDLSHLKVVFPDDKIFKELHIEKPAFLEKITITLQITENHKTVLLTSTEPLQEPFLNFLVDLTNGNFTDRKEYTVLFDVLSDSQLSSPVEPLHFTPTKSYPVSDSAPLKLEKPDNPPQQSVVVKVNETLLTIAKRIRPNAEVSLNQMMLALLRANPDQFIQQNINWVKANAKLAIPTLDEIYKISKEEADAEVARHHAVWKNPTKEIAQTMDANTEDKLMNNIKELIDLDVVEQHQKTLISFNQVFLKEQSDKPATAFLKLRAVQNADALHQDPNMPAAANEDASGAMMPTASAELEDLRQSQLDLQQQVEKLSRKLDIMQDYMSFLEQTTRQTPEKNSDAPVLVDKAEAKDPTSQQAIPKIGIMNFLNDYLLVLVFVLFLIIISLQLILIKKR